ncbi:hypothetical protein AB1Y20_012584 [Prymnesium parvum]|uniref:ATP-grasp domain-containing protein n=1 Tax=Prymnesium parvum TaxID=97485 RepID=A0AB34ILV3_PRYPA
MAPPPPCPLCLTSSDEPALSLACGHSLCKPCGTKATRFGFQFCPQCRAPHVLDVNVLTRRLETHRKQYRSWRAGETEGVKGELDRIVLPRDPAIPEPDVYLKESCGLLHQSNKRVPLHPLPLKCNEAKVLPPVEVSPPDLYDQLLGTSDPTHAAVFAWWPQKGWKRGKVLHHSMRALPAVRPGRDYVFLPIAESVRDMFGLWCMAYGLQPWQAIWYTLCEDSSETFTALLTALTSYFPAPSERSRLHVYPTFLTQESRMQITRLGFCAVGDLDANAIVGSLAEAKGWLHAPLDSSLDDASPSSSLRAAAAASHLELGGVRAPTGFLCTTAPQLRRAYTLLRDAGARVVLKPKAGLGCNGLVLDAKPEDCAQGDGAIEPYIVEEMVGARGGPSPTIYMLGEHVVAIADQLMVGTQNGGNVVPCTSPPPLQAQMAAAGRAIGRYLGLTSQWGMDFVLDGEGGGAVVVDLNMGRPNGSLGNYLWRSLQLRPEGARADELHLLTLSRLSPEDESAPQFVKLLVDAALLWRPGGAEGVLPLAHVGGTTVNVVCASWHGLAGAKDIAARLRAIDARGKYRVDLDTVRT